MENTNTATAICRKVSGCYTQNGVGGGLAASSTPRTKVLIIGLGQLGLPVAKYVLDRGFDT
jgi:spermidine synthase